MENISKIVKEYKEARGLQPHRICVLGAPAVGKSYIVSHLCQHYKLHHIKIADVIKEAIDNLVCLRGHAWLLVYLKISDRDNLVQWLMAALAKILPCLEVGGFLKGNNFLCMISL